jgi:hypothetical protein
MTETRNVARKPVAVNEAPLRSCPQGSKLQAEKAYSPDVMFANSYVFHSE